MENALASLHYRICGHNGVLHVGSFRTNLDHLSSSGQVKLRMAVPLDLLASDPFRANGAAVRRRVVVLDHLLPRRCADLLA
eukprot:5037052-Pyramimonas_sp.AAC.1